MPKKMYSFRLDVDLIKKAKNMASKTGISLSALVTMAVREKIGDVRQNHEYLEQIAGELKLLRDHFESKK